MFLARNKRLTYELEVNGDALQDHPITPRRPELAPFPGMLRVDMCGVVGRPIDACRFRVARIDYVVDVSLSIVNQSPLRTAATKQEEWTNRSVPFRGEVLAEDDS